MGESLEVLLEPADPISANTIATAKPNGRGIIFVPTNGAGLGHLTRLLAIARRLKKRIPSIEIVFFSTSIAKHLIEREGFIGYHFPPQTLFNPPITASQWNKLFLEKLSSVLKYHNPQMLVFDGTYPYLGLIRSMAQMTNIKKIWIKREGSKSGDSDKVCKDKEKFFNYVITPREAGLNGPEEPARIYCDPVIYLEKSELMDRQFLLRQWSVPQNASVIYIQLGAGNINDITTDIAILIQTLNQRPGIFVVLGESIIGKNLKLQENNLLVLKDYPNSRFFNAFDLAICACGYNSFHELLYFGVPSIFVPNLETQKDDQFSRAMRAVHANAGMILRNITPTSVTHTVEHALNCKNILSTNGSSLVPKNGADTVADFITSHFHL